MASFNQIILLGNLTRDPEMRYLPNNSPVIEFGIACNRRFKDSQGQDRDEAMFIDCTAFGKPAEILNQCVHKGDLLFIEGRLKLDTWEDKQGGGKRSKHRVVINNFQLMPRRGGDESSQEQEPPRRPSTYAGQTRKQEPPPTQPPYNGSAGDGGDLDIPFAPNKC